MGKLNQILNDPSLINDIRAEEIPVLLAYLAAVQTALTSRLLSSPNYNGVNEGYTLLDVDQVAVILKIHKTKVYELARQKDGPRFISIGKYKRIAPADLRRWLENQGANLLDNEVSQWHNIKHDKRRVQETENENEVNTIGARGRAGDSPANGFEV